MKVLVFVAVVLLGASAGGLSPNVVAEDTCEHFTLEKVRLGMTQAELEALSLGKIEVLGTTSDTVRLRVRRSKHQEQIFMNLIHGHVRSVQVLLNADAAYAASALADLRSRWGEPRKEEAPEEGKPEPRVYSHQEHRWSDRNCQAYGMYWYNSATLYLVLSSSPDSIRKFDPEKDLPSFIR